MKSWISLEDLLPRHRALEQFLVDLKELVKDKKIASAPAILDDVEGLIASVEDQ